MLEGPVGYDVLARRRFVLQGGWDAVAWTASIASAQLLRFEFQWSRVSWTGAALVAATAVVLQLAVGRFVGLYIHRWRYGTLEEVSAAGRVVAVVGCVVSLLNVIPASHFVPVSTTLIAGPMAFVGMVFGRFCWRYQIERGALRSAQGERVIVFGAGSGGAQVVQAMSVPGSPYNPVALLDDSPDAANLRIKKVRVWGTRNRLQEIAERFDATTVVIAIPSATSELVREVAQQCDALGLSTLVLPPVSDLFGPAIEIGDIRPLTEADLLGRREIRTDLDSVASYLTGRRVLVTGAGGSIGSELCRQIHRFAPASIVMLDRDESALQAVELSIEGRSLLVSENLVVACIRDIDRMREVFAHHRPDVVFHAAALKHLPLLELHPEEGFKTNVLGTQNLLEVAEEFGVSTFVNISTDKAAEASSTLGRTKRLAERLTSWAGLHGEGTYLSVRFGNVLGSRGSVVPLFRKQIEAGGPVTVTDPEVTRYFMTIEEACQLVIQAGAIGGNGEVMVLDMGEPVRIADLARRLIAESSRPIQIEYTGLRPGEKLHEVLFGPDEEAETSEHPLISRVEVPALDPASFADLGMDSSDARMPSESIGQ
jgi:FlaA1/EpsC-like NDP-sugar epimerase